MNNSLTTILGKIPGLIGIVLIRLYRLVLSPLIGRDVPLSADLLAHYTEEAIGRYGLSGRVLGSGSPASSDAGRSAPPATTRIPEALPADAPSPYRPSARCGRWTGAHIDPKTRLDL